jgi:hypothetical protein
VTNPIFGGALGTMHANNFFFHVKMNISIFQRVKECGESDILSGGVLTERRIVDTI